MRVAEPGAGSGRQPPGTTGGWSFELACLDMAGTTVADDGLVLGAFDRALLAVGIGEDDPVRPGHFAYVQRTMGTSKIEVFRALLHDEARAQRANAAFEAAFAELVSSGGARPLPGAEAVLAELRDAGLKVVLTTGFAPVTRDRLLDALGWRDRVDLALSPADAGGRGRPYPDMILHAVLALGVTDVRRVVVAGDTGADMASGRRAGATVVAGVLTGADDEETLWAAGATHVLASVAGLPVLLGLGGAGDR